MNSSENLNSQLLDACREADYSKAKYLIENKADINYTDENDMSALLFSMTSKSKEQQCYFPEQINMILWLIEQGANVNAMNAARMTPLLYACRMQCIQIIKVLLEKNVLISSDNKGHNPIHTIINTDASDDKESILNLLLEYEVNINAENKNGDTPLMLAINKKNSALVLFLLTKGANPYQDNKRGDTPLDEGLSSRNEQIANYFNDPKLVLPEENYKNLTEKDKLFKQLVRACNKAAFVEIKKLIDKGAEINRKDITDDDHTPLHLVLIPQAYLNRSNLSKKQLEIAIWLIENGGDINAKNYYGSTPLHLALSNEATEVVKKLLENGAEITSNKHGDTPLHSGVKATFSADIESWSYLLSKNLDLINQQNNSGRSPLIEAVSFHNESAVKFLIEKGADLLLKDNKDESAKDYPIEFTRNKKILKLLGIN